MLVTHVLSGIFRDASRATRRRRAGSEMATRRRRPGGNAGNTEDKTHVSHAEDQDEGSPDDEETENDGLINGTAGKSAGHPPHGAAPPARSRSAGDGTLTSYVGNIGEMMRNMHVEDVYRYWSVLRDWLSDVPRAAQTMSYGLPPSISSFLGVKGPPVTAEQQEALDLFIDENVGIPYTHEQHWDMLARLWKLSFPESDGHSGELPGQHDAQWKRLGFQGTDPATDFRAAGTLSVKGLLHFAEAYPDKYKDVMMRTHGKSAEESYPFACAGINVAFMLTSIAGLSEWVKTGGTYMRFPFIMNTTRDRTKAALRGNITSVDAVGKALGVDLYSTSD